MRPNNNEKTVNPTHKSPINKVHILLNPNRFTVADLNRKIVPITLLIILVGLLGSAYKIQKAEAATRSISLFGHSTQGWGFTSGTIASPGPTITVDQDDLVSLTLTGVDGIIHNFFVDYDGNTNPNLGEPRSPDFIATTNYEFTADTVGTFTYYCQYHKFVMYGTFIAAPLTDTSPPRIDVLSPENRTYSVNAVALTFVLNETASWMSYSLNSQPNATTSGNATLFGLLKGTHNIIVYANDTSGNMGSSNRVYFTIQPSSTDISPPSILILSPQNKSYNTINIPLSFTLNEPTSWMAYRLDQGTNVTITQSSTLSGLSEGSHIVTVYANDTVGNMGSSSSRHFTVDTLAPTIQVISPENKTYGTNSVSLNFIVGEATALISYSLDGQANTTITGNTTLSTLPEGSHTILVYATDLAGNTGASETVYFTIEIQQAQLPIEIIAVIVIASVAVLGILTYFIKSRSKKSQMITKD
jgi:plastocyanin